MLTNIGSLLTKRAYLDPTGEALFDVAADRRFTFSQLNEASNQVAAGLTKTGLKKGDRVGLLMMNSHEFVSAFFAIAKLGAVIVPLNVRLVPDELEFILKDSGVSVLLAGEEFVPVVTDLQARGQKTDIRTWIHVGSDATSPTFATPFSVIANNPGAPEPEITAHGDDLLYIMYTSGTTGLPKGVMHTHNTQMAALHTVNASSDFRTSDRYLNPMPLFHVGSLTPAVAVTYLGLTHVLMRAFDPTKVWEIIGAERITNALMVPAMLNFMRMTYDPAKHTHSDLRWILAGAAPVPVSLIEAYLAMGIEIHQVYGLTETCGPACVTSSHDAIRKAGSTGKSYFHTDVRVVRADGTDCAVDEPGEVIVRGGHIMTGYLNRPDATAETLRDGWLHTGDIAVVDDEGFVYIKDRLKDMIISGGENVYPAEIENVILSHPGVAEVAVIGIPSDKWGESPLAVVVKKDPELTEADLLAHCDGKLAKYKMPVGAHFVDAIPRNPSGKALKKDLRLQFN